MGNVDSFSIGDHKNTPAEAIDFCPFAVRRIINSTPLEEGVPLSGERRKWSNVDRNSRVPRFR